MVMGMPFVSYDTLEDMLDRPDRKMMSGVATGVAAGASVATGSMMPSVAGVPGVQTLLASFQREFPSPRSQLQSFQPLFSQSEVAPMPLLPPVCPARGLIPPVVLTLGNSIRPADGA
ncbi:hypothetical protein DPMN_028542 [Dreissena polymorpha]|uniref:Uncharacterized protein n=1 Tax=Dreissena polymorpha TaxID=45954 RepID=A0A9D4LXG2_DREPO|nr:hypothetical protein DPMN_028542 [Dreissena polymorpha]